jgi:DNA-binding NarL/FixJ family response regulator
VIRVYACQSEPVVVEGLRIALADAPDFEFSGAAADAAGTLEAVARLRPDIVLIDRDDGEAGAIELAAEIVALAPETRPVLWARDPEQMDFDFAFEMGARAVVQKTRPIEALLGSMRAVAAGRLWNDSANPADMPGCPDRRRAPRLTPRERQILGLVAKGFKNQQIGQALAISPGTVKVHLMHVFEKTGARDRFELALRSRKLLEGDAA